MVRQTDSPWPVNSSTVQCLRPIDKLFFLLVVCANEPARRLCSDCSTISTKSKRSSAARMTTATAWCRRASKQTNSSHLRMDSQPASAPCRAALRPNTRRHCCSDRSLRERARETRRRLCRHSQHSVRRSPTAAVHSWSNGVCVGLGVLCPKACERDARARVPATAAAQGLSPLKKAIINWRFCSVSEANAIRIDAVSVRAVAAPQGLSEKKVEAAMRFPQKCIKACACALHSAVRCAIAVAIAQLIIGEPVIANPPARKATTSIPTARLYVCFAVYLAVHAGAVLQRHAEARRDVQCGHDQRVRPVTAALPCTAPPHAVGGWVGHPTYRYFRRDCAMLCAATRGP